MAILVTKQASPPSSAQLRAARGLLDWSMHDLAQRAMVSVSTVKRVENPGDVSVSPQAQTAIRSAFEVAGVEFFASVNDREGVCFVCRSN